MPRLWACRRPRQRPPRVPPVRRPRSSCPPPPPDRVRRLDPAPAGTRPPAYPDKLTPEEEYGWRMQAASGGDPNIQKRAEQWIDNGKAKRDAQYSARGQSCTSKTSHSFDRKMLRG